jgi:membrane protease YdiL (CAAX protease family)
MTNATTSVEWVEVLLASLFFFLSFLVSTYFAKIKGFFSLPFKNYIGQSPAGIDVTLTTFFWIASLLISGNILVRWNFSVPLSNIHLIALIQTFSFLLNVTLILLYTLIRKTFPFRSIIKDPLFPGKTWIGLDIITGLKALTLALFPLLAGMCFFESILIYVNGGTPPTQDAVKFLIEALKEGKPIFLALFTIIVAAPILEEFLFRGVIQSYFRKKIGPIAGIFSASALFSLFHFSHSQGFQNIFILLSLFILSLYLGFVYEKTRSIIANITLHVTFNLINTIVIIIYNI